MGVTSHAPDPATVMVRDEPAPGVLPARTGLVSRAGGMVLALDIGGTKLAAGLIQPLDGTFARIVTALTPAGDAGRVWRAVGSLIGRCLAGTEDAPAAVAIGCPGPIDVDAGTVSPVNIRAWRDFPLRDRMAELTGVPVRLANDAICAALGEYRWGAGRGVSSMLGIVVSTGVGGGMILDGTVYAGPTGNAGNIGHAIADPDGEPCPCGARGCVETIASGPAMVRRARVGGWDAPPTATAADLAHAAELGDGAAVSAFADAARALAVAIVSASALADLDMVVIGGGVSGAGELILRPIAEQCRRYAGMAFIRRTRVIPGILPRPTAGLLGAASLATADTPRRGRPAEPPRTGRR